MGPPSLLVIGLNYAPEPVGIGPYTAGLCESLVASGHRVTAIVGKPYYPQWQADPAYAGGWLEAEENGVRLVRCPHYVPQDPVGIRRFAHLISFAITALIPAARIALRDRPQVVLCVAPALLSALAAILAACLCGARLWIHVQDFEVEAAFATGLMRPNTSKARFALWAEGWVLRQADRVSTISPQMVAKLGEKGVAPRRQMELRNWANASFAPDPAGATGLRAQWSLDNRIVALYSGNIARKQGIEILIDAARLLQHRHDIVFVICGEGPNRQPLEQRAAGLTNVQFHDLQPAKRMGAMLTLADLHLLPQIAGAADLVLPSKLTNMLASGKPVVATTEPGTGLYSEVEGRGICVPAGDAVALAAAVTALADDPARRTVLGQAALVRAAERWQQDAILARAATALRDLVRQPPGRQD
ncbi:WcaI family glycosyltransferase [Novosphingobium ginsenosidimutans]|uniref:Colanic acid biosynthesis glycosyltransferase WcaI n=1 Tax=Novosphingobium ginsenosidimutans TaxID=1176536 RepID=A0A5B8S3Q5_9SPHN|nr:WcaI family glycosyltransferase [Novosphingobium ginsenosidimutans]QEA15933.1 colanic acid biosynthesis glycosyltransferase WcaI [Novosphingobium ginsenosidimutans]